MARGLRKLEWLFALRDRVSGPAGRMARALDGYKSSLRRSQQFAGRANVNRRLTRGFADVVRMARVTGQEVNATTSLFGQLGEAAPILAGVGSAAVTAALGVARLGAAFTTAAISEAAFQESTLATLRTMLGSDRAARDEFARSLALARQTPLDTADVIRLRTRLVTSGFRDTRERDVMSNVLTDVAAANGGNTEASFNALRGFAQMRASGRFNAQDFNQIRDATGVSQRDVMLRLARMRGLRGNDNSLVQQVEQLRQGRRISSSDAEVAIVEALRAQFGGGAAGSLTAAQANTITGLLSNLRSSFSDLMQGLDLGNLPGIRTFRAFLSDLVTSLSAGSTTGKRLQGVIARIINLLGGGLAGLDPAAMLSRALDVVERLISGGVYLWKYVFRPLGEGLRTGFGEALAGVLPLVRRFFGETSKGATTAELFRTLGRVLGFVAGTLVVGVMQIAALAAGLARVGSYLAPLVNGFLAARTAVVGFFATIGEYLPGGKQDLAKRFLNLGSMIVTGLVTGLESGAERIGSAMLGLAGRVLDGITNPLEIHSPSRVMERLGQYTVAGFAQGLGADGGLAGALADIAPPRMALPAPGALAGLGAGAGGGQISITVQVDASGRDDAEQIGSAIETRLERLFEDLLTRRALALGTTSA